MKIEYRRRSDGMVNKWKQIMASSLDNDLYEEIMVKHTSGFWSRLMLRSYDQGRRIFQGTEQDVVWLDEEVPKDVYDEALVRTMTTRGIVMMTFTPLSGLTELVVSFLESMHEQEPL